MFCLVYWISIKIMTIIILRRIYFSSDSPGQNALTEEPNNNRNDLLSSSLPLSLA